MNSFTQLESNFFATQEALEKLEKKDKAQILVISDTHGATDKLTLILEKFGPKADALLFTGDGIYDLITVMEKAFQYKSAAKWLPPVIGFVQGNNDVSSASAIFSEHIRVPSKQLLKVGSKKILLTHGHNESVYHDITTLQVTGQAYDANAVLFGHTHVPAELNTSVYLMNPGSIGYPRGNSDPSFAVLQIAGRNIFSIFYKIEVKYDVEFTPFFPQPYYSL